MGFGFTNWPTASRVSHCRLMVAVIKKPASTKVKGRWFPHLFTKKVLVLQYSSHDDRITLTGYAF